MKNKITKLSIIGLLAITTLANAQVTDKEKDLRSQNTDTTLGWKKGGVIGIGMSQTSLTNWAAGGQNSVSINGLLSLFAHKKMQKSLWENYLDLGYGILKQGSNAIWQKTDDKIDLTSKYGYKLSKNIFAAGLLNFRTQWTDGFNYPNDSTIISTFMAPGYLLGALGLEYKPTDNFSLFVAPLTAKVTFVRDQTLANAGAFGVDKAVLSSTGQIITPGKNVRTEFGGYLRMFYKRDLMQNVTFLTRLDLFSNYLNNPQNIDVNWEVLLSMKVNKFISATLGTHLIYDHDINIGVDNNNDGNVDAFGPRVQFKEVLNVGFNYKF